MTKTTLAAKPRKTVGRKVKQLRRQGVIPANVFSKEVKSINIQIDEKALTNLLKQVGESGLVYLQVEGEKSDRPVMISQIKRDPVTGSLLHVGWHQVNLKEKVTSAIPVKLTGTAPAEEQHLGILVTQLQEIEMEALPADMSESVEVDISGLAAVGDAVYVKDIKVDSRLAVKSDPEAIVAKIEPLAVEEPKEIPSAVEGEVTAEGAAVPPVEGEQPSSDQVPAPVVDSA